MTATDALAFRPTAFGGFEVPNFKMLPDALAIEALEALGAFEAAFVLDFALAAFFGAAFLAAVFFSAMSIFLKTTLRRFL